MKPPWTHDTPTACISQAVNLDTVHMTTARCLVCNQPMTQQAWWTQELGVIDEDDYKETYEDFWKELVEMPDGTLHVDQVKRELHDYRTLMIDAKKVYDDLTDGRISKPNTDPQVVIDTARECMERHANEGRITELEDTLNLVIGALQHRFVCNHGGGRLCSISNEAFDRFESVMEGRHGAGQG